MLFVKHSGFLFESYTWKWKEYRWMPFVVWNLLFHIPKFEKSNDKIKIFLKNFHFRGCFCGNAGVSSEKDARKNAENVEKERNMKDKDKL